MNYSTNLLNIAIALCLLGCSPKPEIVSSQNLPVSAKAQINNHLIELEVAKTSREQDTGLMYRTSLKNNRGMLFEFKPAQKVNFWMKNCKIPLDMIFLKDGTIKSISPKSPPCTANPCPNYGPDSHVDQVIELQSGKAEELGIKVNDRIKIEFLQ